MASHVRDEGVAGSNPATPTTLPTDRSLPDDKSADKLRAQPLPAAASAICPTCGGTGDAPFELCPVLPYFEHEETRLQIACPACNGTGVKP
jgi:hypothetical protein